MLSLAREKDRFGGPFFIYAKAPGAFFTLFRIIHAFYHINLTLRFHSSSYFPYYYYYARYCVL
ncbi:hypothetical protein HMPREF1502_3487 [Klebsiella sp. AS10]|nr:hypothetical protein CSC12_2050 [Klebsiella michiganensis]EUB35109.1 hypothetical protein HMPREF1502_3487 [Klebsiella sp. AS10]